MEGNFKGFAMLRQMTLAQSDKALPGWESAVKSQPVYIQVRQREGRNLRRRCGAERLKTGGSTSRLVLLLLCCLCRAMGSCPLRRYEHVRSAASLFCLTLHLSHVVGTAPELRPVWPDASARVAPAFLMLIDSGLKCWPSPSSIRGQLHVCAGLHVSCALIGTALLFAFL